MALFSYKKLFLPKVGNHKKKYYTKAIDDKQNISYLSSYVNQ